jgi:hypothetical protein
MIIADEKGINEQGLADSCLGVLGRTRDNPHLLVWETFSAV